MWVPCRNRVGAAVLAGIFTMLSLTSCGTKQEKTLDKPSEQHAVVNMQKILSVHPERGKLQQIDQEIANYLTKADRVERLLNQETAAISKEYAHREQNLLLEKAAELQADMERQRRLHVEEVEAEYRPQLLNFDLKLKVLRLSPAETAQYQQQRDQLEAERTSRLRVKEQKLASWFQEEMAKAQAEIQQKLETDKAVWYSKNKAKLMGSLQSVEELHRKKQEGQAISGRIISDIRAAVAKVAERENIALVWVQSATRLGGIDITEAVMTELTK